QRYRVSQSQQNKSSDNRNAIIHDRDLLRSRRDLEVRSGPLVQADDQIVVSLRIIRGPHAATPVTVAARVRIVNGTDEGELTEGRTGRFGSDERRTLTKTAIVVERVLCKSGE